MWWWSSEMYTNAGLCGPLVSVGSVGTSYTGGIGGTNLGNDCPTLSPSSAPSEAPGAPGTGTCIFVSTLARVLLT